MTLSLGPENQSSTTTGRGFSAAGRAFRLPVWAWAFLMIIPVAIYGILPLLGIESPGEMLNHKLIMALLVLLIGGSLYWAYLRFVLPRPVLPLGFILLAWPLVAYLNDLLLQGGINLHLRPLLLLSVALPATVMAWQERQTLWRALPCMSVYLLFMAWLTLYVFVYNANAVDPRLSGGEEAMGEGSVSMVQWTSYYYCLLAITTAGVAFLKARNYQGLFDGLNKALLWVSSLLSILTIAGYPLGLFTVLLDGFTRAIGIFSHPNPYAHHMGVLMIYLLGLFCYYQGHRKGRIAGWLLYGGIAVNFCAFLLGLSKTAFSVFAVSAAIVFLMNLTVPAVRRRFGQMVLGLLVLLPLGVFAFEAVSGHSFLSLMESRIDQTQSMTWRVIVWQDLIADINMATVWLGHGFTAANDMVFRLTFNDAQNAQPLMMVHNAYIALLYDLGLPGYLLILAAVVMLWQAIIGWMRAPSPALRTGHATIAALVVYFLVVCAFDEMSYMFDAPQFFWALATMLACVTIREQQEHQEHQENQDYQQPPIAKNHATQRNQAGASRQSLLEMQP
jgi:O-antigen ligase